MNADTKFYFVFYFYNMHYAIVTQINIIWINKSRNKRTIIMILKRPETSIVIPVDMLPLYIK